MGASYFWTVLKCLLHSIQDHLRSFHNEFIECNLCWRNALRGLSFEFALHLWKHGVQEGETKEVSDSNLS